MLDPFLEQLNHWDWWIFGMALIVLEVFAPGAVFIWLGFSAAFVGGLVYFMPDISWENQFAAFALLSIASVVIGRRYFQWRPIATDHPHLNRRGERYIGRTATVESAIENGRGSDPVGRHHLACQRRGLARRINGEDYRLRGLGVIG